MHITDNNNEQEQNKNIAEDTRRTGQGDSEKFRPMDNTLQEDRNDSTCDDEQATRACCEMTMSDDNTASKLDIDRDCMIQNEV